MTIGSSEISKILRSSCVELTPQEFIEFNGYSDINLDHFEIFGDTGEEASYIIDNLESIDPTTRFFVFAGGSLIQVSGNEEWAADKLAYLSSMYKLKRSKIEPVVRECASYSGFSPEKYMELFDESCRFFESILITLP